MICNEVKFDIVLVIEHNTKNSEIVFVTLHNFSLVVFANSDWSGVAIYSNRVFFIELNL